MPKNGAITKIDHAGRIVVPKPFRMKMDLTPNSKVEMILEDDSLVIKKAFESRQCIFCGNDKDIVIFKEKMICKNCLNQLGHR